MLIKQLGSLLAVLLFCVSSVFAQTVLQNADGLVTNHDMPSKITTGASPNSVIEKIKVSNTGFDTSPAAPARLKQEGVSESALLPMGEAAGSTILARKHISPPPPEISGNHTAEPVPSPRVETDCETFDGGARKNGVVWCGSSTELPFKVLAERSAPILWFSPNEPLLKKYKLPQPLPCDDLHTSSNKKPPLPCAPDVLCQRHLNDESAVVYYQVRRIVQEQGSTGEPFSGKVLKLDKIEKLTLKYYFYFCVDCGFGAHQHDLENIEFEILIEKEKGGTRYRARVAEVIGAAHGVHWYNNRHAVTKDTAFPITILVEEGKHASAPDADGDGRYEQKSDINKRVRDAWGLRDKLAHRKIIPLFSYYLPGHTNQNRPQHPEHRIGAKAQIVSHPDLFENYKGEFGKPQNLYELKELGCDGVVSGKPKSSGSGRFDLAGALEKRGAGKDPLKVKSASKIKRALRTSFRMEEDDNLPENLWEKALQFSYRWDQSHGFSVTPPLPIGFIPSLRGYFVPRAHFTGFSNGSRRYGLDYLYTPSASRWLDVYGAGGIEWYRQGPGRQFKFGPAWEGGLKFRIPLSFKKRKFFLGWRVGVRTSPTKKFSMVTEPGGGLF